MSNLFDMVPQQQSTRYYQAAPQLRGVQSGPLMAVKNGSLGKALRMSSPVLMLANQARSRRRGVGDSAITAEIKPMDLALIFAVQGALYYQAGKAMQPRGSENWGWWGALWGVMGGPIGIGIMGIIANKKKG